MSSDGVSSVCNCNCEVRADVCLSLQWPSNEAVSALSGWIKCFGKEVHHTRPGWNACLCVSRVGQLPPGESGRVNGPELVSHYSEVRKTREMRLLQVLEQWISIAWVVTVLIDSTVACKFYIEVATLENASFS